MIKRFLKEAASTRKTLREVKQLKGLLSRGNSQHIPVYMADNLVRRGMYGKLVIRTISDCWTAGGAQHFVRQIAEKDSVRVYVDGRPSLIERKMGYAEPVAEIYRRCRLTPVYGVHHG